jgi:hypothetical protein
MKVIFLDIDGVMNSEQSTIRLYHKGYGYYNDIPVPETVGPLNKIVAMTNAKIVISSTWRKLTNIHGLGYILFLTGVRAELVGTTPVIHNVERGVEIQAWLDQHQGEEVTHFVILDDDRDVAHLDDHFVHVDCKVGLTFDDADKAIDILNK